MSEDRRYYYINVKNIHLAIQRTIKLLFLIHFSYLKPIFVPEKNNYVKSYVGMIHTGNLIIRKMMIEDF